MKRLLCALLFSVCFFPLFAQQASLKGVIHAEDSGEPITGVTITLGNQDISTTTNAKGEFTLMLLEPMDEEVIIHADGYLTQVKLVKLNVDQITDMGTISLKPDIVADVQQELLLQLSEAELENDEGGSQNMSTALSSGGDVYTSHISYAFSPMRFRVRGYGQEYENNYINGINFNSQERGNFNYSMIGGLNDATRNKDVTNGIEANPISFGGIGSTTNILTTASRIAAGWKVGLSGTNRNYKGRAYITYGTGVLENGWAFAGSLAYRYSPYIDTKNPVIGEGIFYNSAAYYFSAEKKFNDQHTLALTTFGSPTARAQSAAVTQEAYNLYGSIYYNPYWGYQNGKVRNSRVVKSFDPTVTLNYEWKINENHTININEGFHYSMYSNSALTFYNAPDPRPDYYRNLPSFLFDNQIDANGNFIMKDMNGVSLGKMQSYTAANGQEYAFGPSIDYNSYTSLIDGWVERDPSVTQIQWDELYQANYRNNIVNPTGTAKYMVERRHNDIWENMFNALWRGQLTTHLKMTAGLDTKVSQGRHYKTVDDLLGANQWIDVDPFAERDIADLAQNIGLTQAAIEHVKQNDTENPNRPVKEGDVFGYNYNINMYQASVFAQNEWNFHAVDFYYALKGTFSSFQREGFMENGRAVYLQRIYAQYDPANADTWKDIYTSKGKGYLATFLDPSLKAGVTYKIDGRNHLKANVLAETRAPLARNAYISQRIHDRMVDNLSSAKILSYDLSYEFNFRPVRGRITAYRTHFLNQTELNGYYDDGYRTFVNQAMTGINSIHQGVEFAAAVKMGMYFTLSAAATVSDNHYTSNAYSVTSAENGMALAVSNSGYPLYELRDSVLINGLKVANGPQLAGSLKLSFFHPKMWFADITVSYFDWNYLDFSPSRRMQGLFTGVRADGSKVNGTYTIETETVKDNNGNPVTQVIYDENGHPKVAYPHSILSNQESLVSEQWYNRFLVDLSVGKLIYLPKRQSLSINLSISNLLNNTNMKTGGYQQGRIPTNSKQGTAFEGQNNIQAQRISNNVWKFPAKYYYAWGANFFLNLTYKF